MDFEDIVDMDWLNSHTIESPIIKQEQEDCTPLGLDLRQTFDYTKDMLVMPSTEQIKQLIDLAKTQLALREQLASISEPTPEPESPMSIDPTNITTTTNTEELKDSSEGTISLEAYAASDGIDIKNLTSKEKRQLRNKISARNFRVRRKEYISSLEGQVNEHKKENQQLLERLTRTQEENQQLKLQIESLKCQNLQLTDTSILVS